MNTKQVLRAARVDVALAEAFTLSRAVAARLLEAGRVRLDGRKTRAGNPARIGQLLEVDGSLLWYVTSGPVATLCTTERWIVVDKPAGIPVHALCPGEASVVGSVVQQWPEIATAGPIPEGGLVHRLDNGTSGCLVLARTRAAHDQGRAWWDEADKEYLAVVEGTLDACIIATPLRHVGTRMVADDRGDLAARTEVNPISSAAGTTLVRLRLVGGRRHQLRAHLSSVGHALVGDKIYGAKDDHPWLLHAWHIRAPSMLLEATAPPPPGFLLHPAWRK
jgi:23S rRNA pseudouridine1911/1915/1917 synthase